MNKLYAQEKEPEVDVEFGDAKFQADGWVIIPLLLLILIALVLRYHKGVIALWREWKKKKKKK